MASEATFESRYFVPEPSPRTRKLVGRVAAVGAITVAILGGVDACKSMPTGPIVPGGQQAPIEHVHEQPAQAVLPQNGEILVF